MTTPDPVLKRQLPLIAKIISDETWLEGERRRQAVPPKDPVVQDRVCRVVLALGHEMRQQVLREMAAERQARVGTLEEQTAKRDVAA